MEFTTKLPAYLAGLVLIASALAWAGGAFGLPAPAQQMGKPSALKDQPHARWIKHMVDRGISNYPDRNR